MALNRKQRRSKVRRVDIVLDDADVKFWVEYRPGVMTVEWFDELRQTADIVEREGRSSSAGQMALNTVVNGLSQLLSDWDVIDEDEDGREYRVPPTQAELRKLELSVLLAIVNKIFGEETVGKENRMDLNGTSFRTVERERYQTGIGSFE